MPTALAYALVVAFFIVEPLFRRGASAKSFEATHSDKGSSLLIVVLFFVVVALPPLFNYLHVGQVNLWIVSGLGLLAMVLGLGLRIGSMRVLGKYYSRALRVVADQVIVSEGPYRIVRHPGYLGVICFWIGFGVAIGDWFSSALVVPPLFGVYGHRIRAEEDMLINTFGADYREYCKKTWRLLPFTY